MEVLWWSKGPCSYSYLNSTNYSKEERPSTSEQVKVKSYVNRDISQMGMQSSMKNTEGHIP